MKVRLGFSATGGLILALAMASASFNALASEPPVKQSTSGICHADDSPYYSKTKNYEGFTSLEECLDDDGRLPRGYILSKLDDSAAPTPAGEYDRDNFRHWVDKDGDCQDERAEALISTSTIEVRFTDESRCTVASGRWISPFTGDVIHAASKIDIDHIVSLAYAWDRGADRWTDEEREEFANDHRNMWPVELSLNRSKGARGPTEWLPPAGRCQYVGRFLRISKIYDLNLSAGELKWMRGFLDQNC